MLADGDRLLVLLGRVQRRIRAQAALQGAVVGALITLAAADVALFLLGSFGPGQMPAPAPWMGTLLVGPALGAGMSLWARRTSLASVARMIDRTPSRGSGDGDRVFVALFLRDRPASVLAAAAIRDAVGRALATPTAQVAPWRRPRGLGPLGAAGTLAVGLVLWPWHPAAQGDPPGGQPAVAASTDEDTSARREARAELDRLQQAAASLGDSELMALIAEADRLLDAGADSGRPENLQRLADMAAAARRSAQASAMLALALERVAEALATTPQARRWADAVARMEARGSEREAHAAAERLSQTNAAQRASLAHALARAAAATEALSRAETEKERQAEQEEERRRRLSGLDDQPAPSPGPEANERARSDPGSPERSLKRLERDLRDTADACLRDPAACAKGVRQSAESLSSEMARARSSGERNQLARTLEREVARQGEAQTQRAGAAKGSRGSTGATGAAVGVRPVPAPASLQSGGTEPGGGQEPSRAVTASEAGEASGSGSGQGEGEADGAGPGVGPAPSGQGEKREVEVQSGPGPSRAEVIEGGARRGFAQPGYQKVYREYEAAVEEALDATGVPPGRRRLVRRYFDLIHPR